MGKMDKIIREAEARRASDVHIAPGVPIRFRVDGMLCDMNDRVLTRDDCDDIARDAAGKPYDKIAKKGELDMAGTYADHVRCCLNIYQSLRGPCLAIRLLSNSIPELNNLGMPPVVQDFPAYNKGLVIVTGETGSDKSTTLASILNRINLTRHDRIITLEDPVEYIYEPQLSSIDQREVGRNTVSYAEGLRAILREDPDVILIGEMHDLDTIETALTAAETGHLVFGALHTQSAAGSITMDNMLIQMVRARLISSQTAVEAARDSEYVCRSAPL